MQHFFLNVDNIMIYVNVFYVLLMKPYSKFTYILEIVITLYFTVNFLHGPYIQYENTVITTVRYSSM